MKLISGIKFNSINKSVKNFKKEFLILPKIIELKKKKRFKINLKKNAFKFFKFLRPRKRKSKRKSKKNLLVEQFKTIKFRKIKKLKKKIKKKYVSTRIARNPFILINIRDYNISKYHRSYVFNTYNICL
jgi:uncharacterized FAD-dependent dehydrogenase